MPRPSAIEPRQKHGRVFEGSSLRTSVIVVGVGRLGHCVRVIRHASEILINRLQRSIARLGLRRGLLARPIRRTYREFLD